MALLTFAFACNAPDTGSGGVTTDSATDTSDTSQPLDSADPGLYSPPPGFPFAERFTVPADRGLGWERDPDFSIANYTVPEGYVAADGTWILLGDEMTTEDSRWMFRSEDGLNWTAPEAPILTPTDFLPLDCGDRLEDASVLLEEDGTYRLIVEGSRTSATTHETEWRHWCQARSTDGLSFTPDTAEYFYLGLGTDGIGPSVPGPIVLQDWSGLIYYIGAQDTDQHGIRVLSVSVEGAITPLATTPILPSNDVDPHPVWLEGGGIRLYHTHGYGGGWGYADIFDAITPVGDTGLVDNTPPDCTTTGGECLLDPVFFHLSDDRLVMYYTRLVAGSGGTFTGTVERAFATD